MIWDKIEKSTTPLNIINYMIQLKQNMEIAIISYHLLKLLLAVYSDYLRVYSQNPNINNN